MIIKEFYRTRKDGVNLYVTYSNQNFYIQKEGSSFKYIKAIDIEGAPYTYTETNITIPENLIQNSINKTTEGK